MDKPDGQHGSSFVIYLLVDSQVV